jgi:hypothetical protein
MVEQERHHADIVNGDGVATVLDYDIMKTNWFMIGDTQ